MASHVFSPSALAEARKSKGLSRHQLAKLAGVGHQTIARLERGEFAPRSDTFAALTDALGLSFTDLLMERAA
jgi:transcriptional regulator with XRE-family HTH domain